MAKASSVVTVSQIEERDIVSVPGRSLGVPRMDEGLLGVVSDIYYDTDREGNINRHDVRELRLFPIVKASEAQALYKTDGIPLSDPRAAGIGSGEYVLIPRDYHVRNEPHELHVRLTKPAPGEFRRFDNDDRRDRIQRIGSFDEGHPDFGIVEQITYTEEKRLKRPGGLSATNYDSIIGLVDRRSRSDFLEEIATKKMTGEMRTNKARDPYSSKTVAPYLSFDLEQKHILRIFQTSADLTAMLTQLAKHRSTKDLTLKDMAFLADKRSDALKEYLLPSEGALGASLESVVKLGLESKGKGGVVTNVTVLKFLKKLVADKAALQASDPAKAKQLYGDLNTLADVAFMSRDDLMKLKGISKRTVTEVHTELAAMRERLKTQGGPSTIDFEKAAKELKSISLQFTREAMEIEADKENKRDDLRTKYANPEDPKRTVHKIQRTTRIDLK